MFEKYSPQAGDEVESIHIRNIEDYIENLIIIHNNGNEISGVAKLIIGENLGASGTASGGITIYCTGGSNQVTSGKSNGFIQPVYSNFYSGLSHQLMAISDYEMESIYIKSYYPPSGNITFNIYKNYNSILLGATMGTGGICEVAISGSLTKGDIITFDVDSVSDLTAGNPIFFGIY